MIPQMKRTAIARGRRGDYRGFGYSGPVIPPSVVMSSTIDDGRRLERCSSQYGPGLLIA